jgi:ADP-ribose pyrophosphatase
MAKADEQPEDVILRELQEEAAMTPTSLHFICNYLTSPGGTDESLALYCALGDLRGVGGIHGLPEEGEDIRVHIFPEQQVFDQLYSGCFNNAATLICLQWLLLNRTQLQGRTNAQ